MFETGHGRRESLEKPVMGRECLMIHCEFHRTHWRICKCGEEGELGHISAGA